MQTRIAWLAGIAMLASGSVAAVADEAVTIDNFVRAETDHYFKERVKLVCFGQFCHDREPTPIDRQPIIRMNRDTPY